MRVREGYVNPLSMMSKPQINNSQTPGLPGAARMTKAEKQAQRLQNEKFSVQNSILLLKSSTNGSDVSGVEVEALEKRLEELSLESKAASGQNAPELSDNPVTEINAPEAEKRDAGSRNGLRRFDQFEKEKEEKSGPSAGIYRMQRDDDGGYRFFFENPDGM